MPNVKERYLVFRGTVQGVFFRRTAQEIATTLGLSGYVKNLSNGDVEVLAQGDPESLKSLEQNLLSQFSCQIIDHKESTPQTLQAGFHIHR